MKKKQEEYTMQDAFIREVEEDLKNESLKKLWDKYGLLITVIVVVSLTLAVSYESIKSWYIQRAENQADAYAAALSMQKQGRVEDTQAAFETIVSRDLGIYAQLAKLQEANLLLENGKEAEALELLEKISEDKDVSPQLRDVALIKLASYRQAKASSEEMSKLLAPITSQKDNVWFGMANEMLALVFLNEGKIDEAKNIFNDLLKNPDTSDELKARIKGILSVL